MTPPAGPARRLLILDDDEDVGRTIGAIAESTGFTAISTTDPAVFFRTLAEWAPSHVVVDLVMPELDGIEVIRRLGAQQCRASIIITSGVGGRILDAAQRAAAAHGLAVAGVAPKPFRSETLRGLLRLAPAGPKPEAVAAGRRPDDPGDASEAELLGALDRREFCLFYQPKIACGTGALAGFEALVRWERPGFGLVAPNRFIPVAERTGLIVRLTDQILEEGLAWLGTCFRDAPLLLSLNLSAGSLDEVALAERIADRCLHRGVAPERIVLEITESSAMADTVATLDLLTRFRLKGFHLSIDDFGVGYSSLIRLARLPFSELKIDRMFIASAPESRESRNIVAAIIGLSHSLGLQVTAEGVEDEWTLGFLRESGCDFAQGYFIARPMAGAAMLDWVRSRS